MIPRTERAVGDATARITALVSITVQGPASTNIEILARGIEALAHNNRDAAEASYFRFLNDRCSAAWRLALARSSASAKMRLRQSLGFLGLSGGPPPATDPSAAPKSS